METKQNISIEIKKGDITFVFLMPIAASWGQAWDASFELLQAIKQFSEQAEKQLTAPATSQEPNTGA